MAEHLLDKEILSADDVLLVPKYGKLRSRSHAKLRPFIFSAPMDTVTGPKLAAAMRSIGEIPVVSRFKSEVIPQKEFDESMDQYLIDTDGDFDVFWAVGGDVEDINEFFARRDRLGCKEKVSVAIDIAHGHSITGHQALVHIKKSKRAFNVMCGSICTDAAALAAIGLGATHLRVGIGSGSVCTTRNITGCGFVQLSAIYKIYRCLELNDLIDDVTIIADGGIRQPGDAVKYLAAGAHSIMLGRGLSQTDESAGWFIKDRFKNITAYDMREKSYRGQASYDFQKDVLNRDAACPEGVALSPFKPNTTVQKVIEMYRGGVSSAISYLGLGTIDDFGPDAVEFIKVTTAGYIEGTPHGQNRNN